MRANRWKLGLAGGYRQDAPEARELSFETGVPAL